MKLKRMLALLLTLSLFLSVFPMAGRAEETAEDPVCTCTPDAEGSHTDQCAITLASVPALTGNDPTETTAAPTETAPAPTETTPTPTETTPAPTETTGVCEACGQETCVCCTECGQPEGHLEDCSLKPQEPETPKSLYEQLMALATADELYDALLEIEDPDALTLTQIDALLTRLEALPYEDEYSYEDAQLVLLMLRSKQCNCGTSTGEHKEGCPKFVPVAETVTYGGTEANPTTVTGTSGNATWTAGYYKVPENTTVTISGYVTVQNAVTLILGDGCTLNVNKGIRVTLSNSASLTINGEPKDQTKMGKLNATGHELIGLNLNIGNTKKAGGAGIGGYFTTNPNDRANGPITINGGYITATAGGEMAAGIGTTWLALTQSTINSGVSSGWMDGDTPINKMITINGGVVVATGGTHAAGIGGGGNSPIVGVDIKNARVIATAGPGDAAGIGGGAGVVFGEFASENPKGGTITIESSYVEAYGGTMEGWLNGTAIGDGFSPNAMEGQPGPDRSDISATVKISGDSIVFANAPQSNTDYSFNIIIAALNRENNVSVVFENTKGTVYGDTTLNWDLTIPDGYELKLDGDSVLRVPEGTTLTNNGQITGNGDLIVDGNLKEDGKDVVVNGEYQPSDGGYPEETDKVHIVVNVYYMDADGKKAGPQHAVVLNTVTFEQDANNEYYLPHGQSKYGWFYVAGELTTNHRFYLQANTGEGANTKIILGNDCHWTAKHGIAVDAGNVSAAEFTVYREWPEAGKATGILEAHGTHKGVDGAQYDTAGIGGGGWNGASTDSGEINIYGGDIRVSGAATAANIGSGEGGTAAPIIIHNAKVTSGDAGTAASIGAGSGGKITTIDIGNSVVLATSDQTHNGIGDDTDASGTLTIHDSVIFTDKIGPKDTTYRNSLLFLNEKQTGTTDDNPYGHYDGTLKYADDENKTVKLMLPLVMPETATLTIKDGETLDFDPSTFDYFIDVEFTNNGKIYRDYGSTLVKEHFTANDTIGTQVYEIIEEIDKIDNDDITGEGVETFNNNQLYSLPDKTVTVTSSEKSRLEMKVDPEHSEPFSGTYVAENQQTYPMPADPVKLTGEVFERFDLTITKAFADGVTPQEGEVFLFRIEDGNGYSLTVRIQGAGSVTIKELPYGEYTVTEITDWSWRYKVDSTTGLNTNSMADADHNTLTFTNALKSDKWLDHSSSAQNIFSNTNFGS